MLASILNDSFLPRLRPHLQELHLCSMTDVSTEWFAKACQATGLTSLVMISRGRLASSGSDSGLTDVITNLQRLQQLTVSLGSKVPITHELSQLSCLSFVSFWGVQDCFHTLARLPALQSLNLQHHSVNLNVDLHALSRLTFLFMDSVSFASSPGPLAELTSLKHMTIHGITYSHSSIWSNASMISLQQAIGKLSCLVHLDIVFTGGQKFDAGLLKQLTALTHLRVKAGLQAVSCGSAWQSIQHLDLSGNRMHDLPTDLHLLTDLRELRLNQQFVSDDVSSLHNESLAFIGYMPHLRLLDMRMSCDSDGRMPTWSTRSVFHLLSAKQAADERRLLGRPALFILLLRSKGLVSPTSWAEANMREQLQC